MNRKHDCMATSTAPSPAPNPRQNTSCTRLPSHNAISRVAPSSSICQKFREPALIDTSTTAASDLRDVDSRAGILQLQACPRLFATALRSWVDRPHMFVRLRLLGHQRRTSTPWPLTAAATSPCCGGVARHNIIACVAEVQHGDAACGVALQQAQHGLGKDTKVRASLLAQPFSLPWQRLSPQELRHNLQHIAPHHH